MSANLDKATLTDENNPIKDEESLLSALASLRKNFGKRLGEIMIARGLISRKTLESALKELKAHPGRQLGKLLVDQGEITQADVNDSLAEQFGIPRVHLLDYEIKPEIARLVPDKVVNRYNIIPLARLENVLIVATANPFDDQALSAIRFNTGLTVEPVMAPADEIGEMLSRYYATNAETEALAEFHIPAVDKHKSDTAQQAEAEVEAMRKPVVRLVNAVIMQGIHRGASDINIRPERDHVSVFYRIDGKERFVRSLEKSLLRAVVARIKITGQMNIAEHRLPQDGHARVHVGNKRIDLRISVMPTVKGESVVIRILDKSKGLKNLDDLGFSEHDREVLRNITSRPNGLFLVTGPTGSGKSTTLNAMLLEVKKLDPHIITVEDPVEYDIEGIEQIQVNSRIGYTFAEALRHILRHDPDVVMIGEIRDLETARIANKAALTGHLVFSTLHTNDAASAVTRLIDMGVEPYLLSSTLRGVLAQRLVRVICPHCVGDDAPEPHMLKALGVTKKQGFLRGRGCNACDKTGYLGRKIVYELLPAEGELSRLVARGANTAEIKEAALAQGMMALTQQALGLAVAGVTTLEEVYNTRLE